MRIAYMLTSLGIGGAERQVLALAERMEGRGHEVVLVVLLPRAECEWQTQLSLVRLEMGKSPLGVTRGLMRGGRFLRKFQPDVLHSHTFPANMAARILAAAGAAPAVLSTIHNVYEGGRHRTLAYRFTDRFCMHSTAVSRAAAERYIQIGAVPRHKCSVIANGIDLREFVPSVEQSSAARKFPDAGGAFVWLAAGRAVPAKDFGNLIAAFRLVRAESANAQLWIAGELRQRKLERINGKAVRSDRSESEGIRWLGHCDDMASAIAPADAFVLSSAWEGMPLVVGEAMAMEKPVVATDVGGVKELVGDTGILVRSKDPQALAGAMLRIMRLPPEERLAMGRAARLRISRHFDMDAKAAEWENLYTRLLSDCGQRTYASSVIS